MVNNIQYPQLWQLMSKAWKNIKWNYKTAIEPIASGSGLSLHQWGLLLAVYKFEPDLTTTAHLMVRDPFTAAELYGEWLHELASGGYLIEVSPGKYQLSIKGRDVTEQLIESSRKEMTAGKDLTEEQLEWLVGLLGKLVNACMESSSIPNKWSIKLSYKLMPAPNPPVPYIEQALSCLNAFRDDAYIAAWRKSGMSATALEVLTLFWKGEVNTFDKLCDRLACRGHACDVYTNVVNDLRDQGLIAGSDEDLWITASGRMNRNRVEEDTDGYFYLPWNIISDDEIEKMSKLFSKILPVVTM
jgi:hypothetical protein